jgi:hypothetical protein
MANKGRKKPYYFGTSNSRERERERASSSRLFSEAPFVNRRQLENNINYCNELIKIA